MIRIRFHGRGGHGIKTAGRIVGTAAFLAGYQVQDAPVYGAERRGAAVVAFTRISDEPILERGMIESPDLIILADETLLDDPAAGVLAGEDSASGLFLNTLSAEPLVEKHSISCQVVSFDVTTLTRDVLGRASALSAGLGAAAARLVGLITEEQLLVAMREEFEHLHLPAEIIEKNISLAREVFVALPTIEIVEKEQVRSGTLAAIDYHSPVLGTPSVLAAGNAEQRQTGTWRVERPEIHRDACTRCGLCFVLCPDGAVSLDEEGYPVIDYDHCKGCMICREICPLHAIETKKETRAW